MIEGHEPEQVFPGPAPAMPVVSENKKRYNRAMPVIDGKRICRKCGINQPIENFKVIKKLLRKKGYSWEGRIGSCFDCMRKDNTQRALKYYQANPARYKKTTYENHKAKLSQKYGMTVDQYNSMLVNQNGGCAICGAKQNKDGRRLCVDHDHETGKIRGLLCNGCNAGIGNLGDNPDRLRLAAVYLEKYKTRR